MNKNFSRIITLLRKEKALSQKQAAEELGISQALLSHYEKGIRECSLDFVVKAAEYYDVSCDYLLGHSAERNYDISQQSDGSSSGKSNTALQINRRLLANTLGIIYDIISSSGSRKLAKSVNNYMMIGMYKLLRQLYSANPENPQDLFAIPEDIFRGYASAAQEKHYTDVESLTGKSSSEQIQSISELAMSPDIIAEKYPNEAGALFNLIQHAENSIGKIKR